MVGVAEGVGDPVLLCEAVAVAVDVRDGVEEGVTEEEREPLLVRLSVALAVGLCSAVGDCVAATPGLPVLLCVLLGDSEGVALLFPVGTVGEGKGEGSHPFTVTYPAEPDTLFALLLLTGAKPPTTSTPKLSLTHDTPPPPAPATEVTT
jgi:hypothetical protein